MAKTNLADQFDLSDVDPAIDKEAAMSFLSQDDRKTGAKPKLPKPKITASDEDMRRPMVAEVWTSRTVRLRHTTAQALTKATYGQRTKMADGKLLVGDPVTVQDIADHGIRLALTQLGYLK